MGTITDDGCRDPEVIGRVLRYRRIAVVGASANPHRDSHRVIAYLLANGYDVVPVNPNASEVLGQPCYPALAAIPDPVDIVDVFRRRSAIPGAVAEAIAIGARALWLQLGVIDVASAGRAYAAGLDVVMDRCIKVEHASNAARAHSASTA